MYQKLYKTYCKPRRPQFSADCTWVAARRIGASAFFAFGGEWRVDEWRVASGPHQRPQRVGG